MILFLCLVLKRKDEVQVRERIKRDQGEIKLMAIQVNKIVKEHKIALPITKEGFMRVCKALDMHCSEMLAFEGLLYCRGKQLENSRAEDFDFDRMCAFLTMKSKIVAPASNPRLALTMKQDHHQSFDFYPQHGA